MNYLTLEQIEAKCPSALTQKPATDLSHIYRFIPTTEVIDVLAEHNWHPTTAGQPKTRKGNEYKIPYKKHLLRFRNSESNVMSKELGDTFPEIVMINSHNGSSSFRFNVGLYRLVCGNGLVVADKIFSQHRIPHKGFQKGDVIKAINEITENIPIVAGRVQSMKGIELSKPQQLEFASQAAVNHWGEEKTININDVLKVRRVEDEGNDLWTVFNKIQENILTGGVLTMSVDNEGIVRKRKARKVNSIDTNIRVNQMLWGLAETLV